MDHYTIVGGIPKVEPQEAATRYIAGFWRRLFAFVVDMALISIPGLLLGRLFYRYFPSDLVRGRLIGSAITIGYFALLGSSIGNGQTLGQRWTGIETVDACGNHLSPGRSFLRYTVLLVPFLLGNILPSYLASLAYLCRPHDRLSLSL